MADAKWSDNTGFPVNTSPALTDQAMSLKTPGGTPTDAKVAFSDLRPLMQLVPTAVKTTTYTAAAFDLVPCDSTSGGFTVTLPAHPTDGTLIGIKHILQGSTNIITVNCGGTDTYNRTGGATTMTLPLLAQASLLLYKLTSGTTGIWYIICDDLPLSQLDSRYVNVTGDAMTGVLDMSGQRIASVGAVTTSGDALSIGTALGLYLPTAVVSAGAITGGSIRQGQSIILTGNYSQTVPPTEEAVSPGVRVNWRLTMSDNAGGLGPQYGFANPTDGFGPPGIFDISGLIRVASNMGTFTFPPIGFANVLKVANNAGVARTITPAWRFLEAGTIYADGATVTLAANDINSGGAAFTDSQVLGTKNSGTLTGVSNSIGLTSVLSSPIVLGNTHVPFRYGMDIMEPNFYLGSIASSTLETALGMDAAGGGVIDQQIGINIRRLTYGTTNIGIKNASTSVEPLLAATLANAAATIPITATAIAMTNSSGGALTLTSTPIMAAGQDGQRITLLNVGANSIILNDGGSSGLQFRSQGSRITLVQGDIATFVYSTTLSLWLEVTAGSLLTSATMTGANVIRVLETGTGDHADFVGTGGSGLSLQYFLNADSVARSQLSALALAFGSGSGAADWSLARTSSATATITGSLLVGTATTGSTGVTINAGTQTLTNKRVTLRAPAVTQAAAPTYNTDNSDVVHITGLAQAITSMTTNATGTPAEGDKLYVDITDNGTARAITWGANFEASGTVALPTTTVISTRLDVAFKWNTVTSKWRCVGVA